MSEYFVIESFKLHDGQLDNWKKLSKEIDGDISKADGFISRDSGIDEDKRVYCLVKWKSKSHQEAFMKELMARDGWEAMMNDFGKIANMETDKRQEIEIF
ncbi:MAG: hypothetical protein HON94_00165 [Methylococcales bacterium]|jgi:heme-degrading monooxygenase HmoA|nr:hypothetical protein [Methylococcales bacterium]MBT7409369.1 hypothetical protein [Methylococcales bacterium]